MLACADMPGAEETCREENAHYAPTSDAGNSGGDIYGMAYTSNRNSEGNLYDDSWQTEDDFDAG